MKIKSNRTFIIAEIGPNHNGSFKRAIKMVKQLAKIDVDAIKALTTHNSKTLFKEFLTIS